MLRTLFMGSIRNLSAGDPALHSHTIGKEATCDAAADIPIVGFDGIFGDFGLSDTPVLIHRISV